MASRMHEDSIGMAPRSVWRLHIAPLYIKDSTYNLEYKNLTSKGMELVDIIEVGTANMINKILRDIGRGVNRIIGDVTYLILILLP